MRNWKVTDYVITVWEKSCFGLFIDLVSISPTFYEQLFHMKMLWALLSNLEFVLVFFGHIIQVSLAIRGGYVPHKYKSKTTNTKSCIYA